MELNTYQSPIPDNLSKYVRSELHEAIDQITFISNLISKDRPTISSLPINKDNGTIPIDLANPHILEDMDYFRQPALNFLETGNYCPYYPNSNPRSEFQKFWREEAIKCRTIVVRPDGEWIPGMYYFYLNYSPILKVIEKDNIASRVESFPDVYDGDYLYYHYVHQARIAFKHCALLKARGKGFSFKGASKLQKMFILGDNELAKMKIKAYAIADEKEYLIKDGILNKFVDQIDFCSENTPFPHIRDLKDSLGDMHWKMGWKEKGTTKSYGTLNEVLGVSLKNDPQRARGKRGSLILWEEIGKFPGFLDAWKIARPSVEAGNKAFGTMIAWGTGGCLTGDNMVWTNSGELIKIKDLTPEQGIIGFKEGFNKEPVTYWQPPTEKECLLITTNSGRTLECSLDHPIYTAIQQKTSLNILKFDFKEAENLNIGDIIATIDNVNIWSDKELSHARTIGWLIGDGTYGQNQSTRISNCEEEIISFLENNYDCKTTIERETKLGKTYKEIRVKNFNKFLREIGIYGQTKTDKRLPNNIHGYSKESVL